MSEPTGETLSVDGGGEGLIARFQGARPPAPAWFEDALAQTPERSFIVAESARIEALAWGDVGAPGLLFLHGNGAHADWWSPIAPFFASERRVAAISWSGMGGSDWRDAYSMEAFIAEAHAALEGLGLFAGVRAPLIVAHSFGGVPAFGCAGAFGDKLAGVVIVDTPDAPPRAEQRLPERNRPNRVYPTLEAALARFRLAPPQPCENLFYVDHVARGSIKAVETADGTGFTWRFDPQQWGKLGRREKFRRPQCPMALVWGDRSSLMPPETIARMRPKWAADAPFITIPDANHHLMLDQPLAFVAALRGLMSTWPKPG